MSSNLNKSIKEQAKIIQAIETLGGIEKFDDINLIIFATYYYGDNVVRDLFKAHIDGKRLITIFKEDYYAELGILKGDDLYKHATKQETKQVEQESQNKPLKRKPYHKYQKHTMKSRPINICNTKNNHDTKHETPLKRKSYRRIDHPQETNKHKLSTTK